MNLANGNPDSKAKDRRDGGLDPETVSKRDRTDLNGAVPTKKPERIFRSSPEWDFNGLDGSESFYFDSEGRLVICFDEYQVAPGYMGAVEFTIPKEITGELQSH